VWNDGRALAAWLAPAGVSRAVPNASSAARSPALPSLLSATSSPVAGVCDMAFLSQRLVGLRPARAAIDAHSVLQSPAVAPTTDAQAELEVLADSVQRKRKRKMNKHKHRKLLKQTRIARRAMGK